MICRRAIPLVREAISRRLARLPDTPEAKPQDTGDPEEALRLFMVKCLPRLHAGADTEQAVSLLRRMAGSAEGNDPRFIDAFHHLYETVLGAEQGQGAWCGLVSVYRQGLQSWLGRLESPSPSFRP